MMMRKGDKADTSMITRGFFWAIVAVSLLVAALERLAVIAPPDFPLGEGGLFVLFPHAILDKGFAMPAQLAYGGVTIPFAYPPASFYVWH
jgi:hypothetical protein